MKVNRLDIGSYQGQYVVSCDHNSVFFLNQKKGKEDLGAVLYCTASSFETSVRVHVINDWSTAQDDYRYVGSFFDDGLHYHVFITPM